MGIVQGTLQLVAQVAGHGADDVLGPGEGLLEVSGLAGNDLQMGDFQYHDGSLPMSLIEPKTYVHRALEGARPARCPVLPGRLPQSCL